MVIILTIVGVIIGLAIGRDGGFFYAGMCGLLTGLFITTAKRLKQVENELKSLQNHAISTDSAKTPIERSDEKPQQKASIDSVSQEKHTTEEGSSWQSPTDKVVDYQNEYTDKFIKEKRPPFWQPVIDWISGGNIMVRVGVIVLFFGIAFLIKYASDHSMISIELRLAGIAAGGIAMLILGWRLRTSKRNYALVLQGGAVGVLYLTVFAALRLYTLIPASLAFTILLVFVSFSTILAIIQNASALAILAASGGFLAPILTSTGEGSHVQLFSYYVMLNLGILAISWFKSWRLLNVTGFVFTFVIASAWGAKYYKPFFFNSTEPFLILFCLMYVAITVMFAFRQPVKLRGYVDSTLIFGVPLVGFALQSVLLRDSEYGLAVSAIVAAVFYIFLAKVLYEKLGRDSRLIAEAFLAIGIVFVSMSIPLALDASWTAAMWALEGAAMIWVGQRQAQKMPRVFGYLLQSGAGIAFFDSLQLMPYELPLLNGYFIGSILIALAGLFTAWSLRTSTEKIFKIAESGLWKLFFIWSLLWWFGGWLFEINEQTENTDHWTLAMLVFMSLSSFVAIYLQKKLDWQALCYPAWALYPFAVFILAMTLVFGHHPLYASDGLGWLAVFVVHWLILRANEDVFSAEIKNIHRAGFWLFIIVVSWEIAWSIDSVMASETYTADTWYRIAWGLVPAGFMFLIMRYSERLPWPVNAYAEFYREKVIFPIALYLWLWVVLLNLLSRGSAEPLDFIPLLNPMDLAVSFILLLLFKWLHMNDEADQTWRFANAKWLYALTVFGWLNAMWIRTAHHWLDISFNQHAMFNSQTVQSGFALLWSICGLGCMIAGTHKQHRYIWFAGAGLMAVVVTKLFLVDLSNTGTVARIISFISVGLVLLVVGYFSPVPPKEKPQKESIDTENVIS